jgi:hypothetical protein
MINDCHIIGHIRNGRRYGRILVNLHDVNIIECFCKNLSTLMYNQNALNIFTLDICCLQKHFDISKMYKK